MRKVIMESFNTEILEQVNLKETFKEILNDYVMFDETFNTNPEMYECFANLHEKIQTLNDSLIDCCLFYVLNGLSSENPKIRFYSLQMLLKYFLRF